MARINDLLSTLLLEEIAQVRGITFAHPDRITRAEAQEILTWAKVQPNLRKAYLDKGHQHHETVALYAQLVNYFASEHPQDAGGAPVAWPARGARPAADPSNPLGSFFPDEAEAFLVWAKTRPEYREAFFDAQHPRHAEMVRIVEQSNELAHGIADGVTPTTDPAPQAPPVSAEPPIGTTLEELKKNPAYWDKTHPDHERVIEAKLAILEGRPAAGAVAAPVKSAQSAAERISEARRDPAYWSKDHPEHAAAVERVGALHSEAHAEPPAAASTTAPRPE